MVGNEKKDAAGATPCTQDKYTPVLKTLQEGSHIYMILDYLIKHGSITPKEAEAEPIDCHRLSGRILDLRRKGVMIETISEPNKKHRGSHAKYVLI